MFQKQNRHFNLELRKSGARQRLRCERQELFRWQLRFALFTVGVLMTGLGCSTSFGHASPFQESTALVEFDRPQNQNEAAIKPPPSRPGNPEIGTAYRRTKHGWEDSSEWFYRTYSVPQQLDAVHPVIWAGITLGLALIVLFGCSKQSEIDQWFTDLDQLFTFEAGNGRDQTRTVDRDQAAENSSQQKS